MKTLLHRRLLTLTVMTGAFATTLGAGAAPVHAAPAGAQEAAFRLPARSFSDLQKDVAKARRLDPRSFALVSDVVALAPQANARARARHAPIALYLAKLGPTALMPMLEMLALAPPQGVPAEAAPAVRRDLIEAVGLLHDARGLPVLGAILEDVSEDPATTRTTTEAMARIGTDDAATRILAALATARDARARAIVSGMGECRLLRVTETLADRLRSATDDATALAATRALGRAGNAWAWKTLTDRSEEDRIRETAARALVDSFVRRAGEPRTAAANALLVVDAPVTASLIANTKKTASPETAKALEALAARFAHNPVHGRR